MQEAVPPTTLEGITYTQGGIQPAHEELQSQSNEAVGQQAGGDGGVQPHGSPQTTIQKITSNPQYPNASSDTTSTLSSTVTSHHDDEHPHYPKSPSEHSKDTHDATEQFHDRSPVQTPISFTHDTKSGINSSGKRLLEAIPTELDSNKIKKKNELLMNEANEKLASKILGTLLDNPWAPPFEAPVDPEALNLPDYFDIIKRPMDLGTIGNNLKEKKYTNVPAFIDDLKLVFNNAMLYNAKKTDIHKAASKFLTEIEELLKNTQWVQAYDNKIPEVTTPIVTITKKPVSSKSEVTHIEEPKALALITRSPPSPSSSSSSSKHSGRNGSHTRSGGSKHGFNCLVFYQNESIPYDFEWSQLLSREDFEQKLRSALSIPSLVELDIGIKRSKPNFGREVFVQLSPRWEEFPRVACVLVKHKKQ